MLEEIIIIPDLHGDFEECYNILINFKITSLNLEDFCYNLFYSDSIFMSNINLTNKKIIFLGDILDSLPRNKEDKNLLKYSDMFVFYLANRLKDLFGNKIILILGNHELLNMYSIFDYVNEYSERTENIMKYIRKKIKTNFLISYRVKILNELICFTHSDVIPIENENKIKKFLYENENYTYNDTISKIYETLFNQRFDSPIKDKFIEYNKYNLIFFGHSIVDDIKKVKNRMYIDQGISKSFLIQKTYKIPYIVDKLYFLEIKKLNTNTEIISKFMKKFSNFFEFIN